MNDDVFSAALHSPYMFVLMMIQTQARLGQYCGSCLAETRSWQIRTRARFGAANKRWASPTVGGS